MLPVVPALGQLLMDARNAFVFAPCLDLFENHDKGPIGDLDIAVILEGQFVIGEVKRQLPRIAARWYQLHEYKFDPSPVR